MSTPQDPDGLVDVIGVVACGDLTPRTCWGWLDLIFERMAANGQRDVVEMLAGICSEQGIAIRVQEAGGRAWVSVGVETADPDSPALLGHVVAELVTDPEVLEAVAFAGIAWGLEPGEAA